MLWGKSWTEPASELAMSRDTYLSQPLEQVLLLGPVWEDPDDDPDEALRLLRTMPLLKLMPCSFQSATGPLLCAGSE